MLDYDVFTHEDGNNNHADVTLLGLSTCGFCKRAIRFLKEQEVTFRYAYIDTLDREIKEKIKDEVRRKFNTKLLYPILIVNEKEVFTGFTSEKYREALNLEEKTV